MSRESQPRPVPILAQHHVPRPMARATRESVQAALDSINRRWGPNVVAAAEATAKAVLDKAGLPTDPGRVFPRPNGGGSIGLAREAQWRGHEVGSEVWFAAKIMDAISDVRCALDGNNPEELLDRAVHFGALLMEARIVVRHGRELDTGVKIHAARSRTGRASNAKRASSAQARHNAWTAAARQIWTTNPGLSTSACARVVIGRLDLKVSDRIVRDVIGAANPQKVGRAG